MANKGRVLGPREGALPDKILGFVEAGISDIPAIGREIGLTPHQVKHALYGLCRTGIVEIRREEVIGRQTQRDYYVRILEK